jgi:glycine/D-amino acid oxidase-like deaminating enzyme
MSQAGPLEGTHQTDVVVVGAGLAGCVAAWELSRRGRRVIVLDSESAGQGGLRGCLGIGLTVPYRTAVDTLGRETARDLWSIYGEAHEHLRRLLHVVGSDHGYRGDGGFWIAETRDQAVALADSEDLLREDGFAGEFLDHYMLESRFDVRGFSGAYWAADEATVDSRGLALDLARRAGGLGVRFFPASPALALTLGRDGAVAHLRAGRVEAEWALLADDAIGPRLVPFLADRLKVEAGEVAEFSHRAGARLPSPARTLAGVGWREQAAVVEIHRSTESEPAGPPDLAAFARTHFPEVTGGRRAVRPVVAAHTADSLPLVGRIAGMPAVAACGFGWLGEALAPQAAAWAADSLASGRETAPPRLRADR